MQSLIFLIGLAMVLCGTGARFAVAVVYETANFQVECYDPVVARNVGDAAERCRTELWLAWLGTPPPDNWAYKAEITVKCAPNIGAGGATSMAFDAGEVFGFSGTWQGNPERLIDSVVPHEVMHTVLASHFRRPIPRWIDEGICTTLEHESEIDNWRRKNIESLNTRRSFPTDQLFGFSEYPEDVATMYAQGWSVVAFLLERGDRGELIRCLTLAYETRSWPEAMRQVYGFPDLLTLQNEWVAWVNAGQGNQLHVAGQCPGGSCGQQIQWIQPQQQPRIMAGTPAVRPAMVPRTFAGGQPATAAVAPAPAAKACDCGPQLAAIGTRLDGIDAQLGAFAKRDELSKYLLRDEATQHLPDVSGFVKRTELPPPPDLSNVATRDDVAAIAAQGEDRDKTLLEKIHGVAEKAKGVATAAAGAAADGTVTLGEGIKWGHLLAMSVGIGGVPGIAISVVGALLLRRLKARVASAGGRSSEQPFPGH